MESFASPDPRRCLLASDSQTVSNEPLKNVSIARTGCQAATAWVGPTHGGRLEGRLLRVAERAHKTAVGQFHSGPLFNYVLPFDHRTPFEIVLPHGQEWPSGEELAGRNRQFGGESEVKGAAPRTTGRRSAKDLDGMIVDVELTTYQRPAALPRGRVMEILGRREEFGVDV